MIIAKSKTHLTLNKMVHETIYKSYIENVHCQMYLSCPILCWILCTFCQLNN